MSNINQKKRILITGASGFLGREIQAILQDSDYEIVLSSSKCHDLTKIEHCKLATQNINTVIHLAGLVLSRKEQQLRPAEVFSLNTLMAINIAEASRLNGVRRILFISSVTAYPENISTPFTEDDLLKGPVSSGNYAYGTAKRIMETIARSYSEQYALETCVLFLPNLYGPNDKFDYNPPPLIPNIILQIHKAMIANERIFSGGNNGDVELDLLYVTDAAKAVWAAIEAPALPLLLNIGTGRPISIKHIHTIIAEALSYKGKITWAECTTPPSPRVMDTSKASSELQWESETTITEGITLTVADYLVSQKNI